MRYYIGVDWADTSHAIWVEDEHGAKVLTRTIPHTAEGLGEWGRWLDEQRAQSIELWAAIERPDGRVVDFLLDHGVSVYPLNPKALDRARDRYRMSSSKSDPFDAHVLAAFLRTDQPHLQALQPSSAAAQELKLLTRDYSRLVREQTRLVNQLTATLKEYYPRARDLRRRHRQACGRVPAGLPDARHACGARGGRLAGVRHRPSLERRAGGCALAGAPPAPDPRASPCGPGQAPAG